MFTKGLVCRPGRKGHTCRLATKTSTTVSNATVKGAAKARGRFTVWPRMLRGSALSCQVCSECGYVFLEDDALFCQLLSVSFSHKVALCCASACCRGPKCGTPRTGTLGVGGSKAGFDFSRKFVCREVVRHSLRLCEAAPKPEEPKKGYFAPQPTPLPLAHLAGFCFFDGVVPCIMPRSVPYMSVLESYVCLSRLFSHEVGLAGR